MPCTVGSTVDCPTTGSFGYSATTGYDLATGIGTIDANVLASGLAALGVGALARGTTTTLTPSVTTPGVNAAVTFNVIVSANDASGAPTGTVQFAVDGTNSGGPVSLSSKTITETTPNGSVSYTEQQATLSLSAGFATTGAHTVTATYSGDSNFSGSSATLGVTVASGRRLYHESDQRDRLPRQLRNLHGYGHADWRLQGHHRLRTERAQHLDQFLLQHLQLIRYCRDGRDCYPHHLHFVDGLRGSRQPASAG